MNLLKITLPAFFITSCSVLLYFYFTQLPAAVQQASHFLPYVLALAVLLVAMYFNQSALFYLGLAVSAAWLISTANNSPSLTVDVFFMVCGAVVLLVSLLPEKGLFTYAAWATHLSVWALIGAGYGLLSRTPDWFTGALQTTLGATDSFNGSPLQPVALLFGCLILLFLLVLLLIKQPSQVFNGLISLSAVLLMLWLAAQPVALIFICCGCLLLLLLSALQQAWHLAYVDELTALPGRRALTEKLQRSLGIYALAMVDVDHFKKFNDNYGHDVGDDVLRMIAAKIDAVEGGGKAFRYGGEEFTIVFNNHSADEIKHHLKALIEVIANTPFVVNRRTKQKPKTVQITVSIGLTDSIHKSSTEQTIKTADQALYQAKKKGRNRLQIKN